METAVRRFDFKPLPLQIEVKELRFAREHPNLLGRLHRAAFYQMVWLTEGRARFHIDFREVGISAGEMLIIAAGQVCRFDMEPGYEGRLILFTGSFFGTSEADANFLHTAGILSPMSLNRTVAVCPGIIGAMASLLEEELRQPPDEFRREIAHSALRIMLLEAERRFKAAHPPLRESVARRFYNAVESGFRSSRSVDHYLRLLGVGEKALAREIRAVGGGTPKAYIDSRTILEARRMLAYGTMSAKEIGFGLGFGEPANFNKYFRKHTGMAPAQFRKSAAKQLSGGELPLFDADG